MECISPVFIRKIWNMVPCGKCNFCIQSLARDWIFRLQWEERVCTSSKFITLTYDNENLPLGKDDKPTLVLSDLQKFLKRLRKYDAECVGKSRQLRYFAVGEYGGRKGRPHYHVILFNAKEKTLGRVRAIWGCGSVDVGSVSSASIAYVAGYVFSKRDHSTDVVRPFATMSRRPGIGSNYLTKNKSWHKEEHLNQEAQRFHVLTAQGGKQRLPRYYKDKIFTTGDKEYYNARVQKERVEAYLEEIAVLRAFNAAPDRYREERIWNKHEQLARQNRKLKSL